VPAPAAAPPARPRAHPHLAQGHLIRADRHRRIRCPVRIHPDDHRRHRHALLHCTRGQGDPWRARLIPKELAGARASFEPRHGQGPGSRHVVRKPDPQQGGPAAGYRARATGTSQRYDQAQSPSKAQDRNVVPASLN
jgi:hypothetical protein